VSGDTPIRHVTDTAFWVATYRAEETERLDGLFRDPLASRLTGDLGPRISRQMHQSRYVRWSVVIRTVIIDQFIRELLKDPGIDLVLNLGAGLDTRPYRMELPKTLRWIEVDYPETIQLKEQKLAGETPCCRLERVAMDLANAAERQKLFSRLSSEARRVLVLTEGVVPYLTEEDVAALGNDLHAQGNFDFWIAEYLSPRIYRYVKSKKRERQMRNAPFRFLPQDWYGAFDRCGWKPRETRFLDEVSMKMSRPMPMPWWAKILMAVTPAKKQKDFRNLSGFVLFARR